VRVGILLEAAEVNGAGDDAARRRLLPDERDLAIDRRAYMLAAYAMFLTAGVGLLVDRLAGRPGTSSLWVAGVGAVVYTVTAAVSQRRT